MLERLEKVPEWLVERLLADDLSEQKARDVRSRLEQSGDPERLEELRASNSAILAAHPSATVAAELRRRLANAELRNDDRRSRWRGALVLPSLAAGAVAAAGAVLFLRAEPERFRDPGGVGTHAESEAPELESARIKGLRPHLVAYKKTPSGAARLGSESRVLAGDVVQLAYVAAGRRFGVIASIDSAGTVTLHLPEEPGAAAQLVAGGETALSHAFELDAVPGSERFVFVTSDKPFSTIVAVESLRRAAPLPRDFQASELVVQKETP